MARGGRNRREPLVEDAHDQMLFGESGYSMSIVRADHDQAIVTVLLRRSASLNHQPVRYERYLAIWPTR